jgi:hypothetical protein
MEGFHIYKLVKKFIQFVAVMCEGQEFVLGQNDKTQLQMSDDLDGFFEWSSRGYLAALSSLQRF